MDRNKFDEMMAKNKTMSKAQIDNIINDAVSLPGAVGEEEAEVPSVDLSGSMQFGFDVVEVQRVGLQPGDVLMVTVKNDELTQKSVNNLRSQLQKVFPSNKVFVFAMGTTDDVKLSVVSQTPIGYCSDCSCGKKEAAQSEEMDEHMRNLAKHAGEP